MTTPTDPAPPDHHAVPLTLDQLCRARDLVLHVLADSEMPPDHEELGEINLVFAEVSSRNAAAVNHARAQQGREPAEVALSLGAIAARAPQATLSGEDWTRAPADLAAVATSMMSDDGTDFSSQDILAALLAWTGNVMLHLAAAIHRPAAAPRNALRSTAASEPPEVTPQRAHGSTRLH